MRLDKYLKTARVFKRRAISKEMADHARILVNDKIAKPALHVKVGDIITVSFGNRQMKIRVLQIADNVKKNDADMLYEVVQEE